VLDGLPSHIIGILPADCPIAKLDADVWEPHTSRKASVVEAWFVIIGVAV
jgi:hypothetical protein